MRQARKGALRSQRPALHSQRGTSGASSSENQPFHFLRRVLQAIAQKS